jgi:(E)-4-hydroxy-3-methylbut-2-enyl-diphosphate synthase
MGDKEQISKVVAAARERTVPIRIGVNAGSLPPDFQPRAPLAERMLNMALEQTKLMESLDFDLIKVSLKAFDVPTTIQAYQMIADRMPYPLHLGATEAGLPRTGAIRSAIGIGVLLHQGIGDTVRISLTAHPCEEVFVAYEILKSLGLRQRGPTLVSCPSCGRAEVDIIALAEAVDQRLASISEPIKVAVMGCVVNGPGEAKDADAGIAGGKGKGAVFKKGKVVGTVSEDKFLAAIMAEVDSLIKKGTEQR